MAWAYAGNEGYVPKQKKARHRALYRVWDAPRHRYTTSKAQYDRWARGGARRDGIAAWIGTRKLPGYAPLFRLVDPDTGDMLLTSKAETCAEGMASGYGDIEVFGFVSKAPRPGYQPLYRAYDPKPRDHLYANDVKTIDEYGPVMESGYFDELLRRKLRPFLLKRTHRIYLADDAYYCPSEKVATGVFGQAKLDRRTYILETFDCDDFAHLLKSAFIDDIYDSGRRSLPYAMGIIWGLKPEHHAMNVIVLSDGQTEEVRIIEPQDGSFLVPSADVLDEIYLVLA